MAIVSLAVMIPSIPLPLEPAVWPHAGTPPDPHPPGPGPGPQPPRLRSNNHLSLRLSTSRSVCRAAFSSTNPFIRLCQLIVFSPAPSPHPQPNTQLCSCRSALWKAARNVGQRALMLSLTQGWLLAGSCAWGPSHPNLSRGDTGEASALSSLEDVAKPSA